MPAEEARDSRAYTYKEETLVDTQEVEADSPVTHDLGAGWARTKTAIFQLDVTASDGTTETLDVDIQHSIDGGDNWYTLDSYTQATGVTNELVTITGAYGDKLQAVATIGSGSADGDFTYTIKSASEVDEAGI